MRVYHPPMETKQSSSFSDTDVKKEKEYRQKSTLCHLPVSSKEKKVLTTTWVRKTKAKPTADIM